MIDWITTKFGTKLKPTKASWKSQLYNLPFWQFRDKTPKLTLDLKHEFGNKGKNSLTPKSKNCEALELYIHLYLETLAHNK